MRYPRAKASHLHYQAQRLPIPRVTSLRKAMRDTHLRRCPSQSLSPVNTALLSDNPLGWSKAQMNVLQHAQETAPQDAWASGNAANFAAQESPQHRAHFNMLRNSSSSQEFREFREPALRHFLRIPNHPARKQEDIEIKQHIDEYCRTYPHLASPNVPQPHQNLLVYIHLHSNSDHYPGHAPLQPNFRDEGAMSLPMRR
jgi:hypothetical protein